MINDLENMVWEYIRHQVENGNDRNLIKNDYQSDGLNFKIGDDIEVYAKYAINLNGENIGYESYSLSVNGMIFDTNKAFFDKIEDVQRNLSSHFEREQRAIDFLKDKMENTHGSQMKP